MRAVVIGTGATGARIGRQLITNGADELTLVGRGSLGSRNAASSIGKDVNLTRWSPAVIEDASVIVIATPHDHITYARAAVEQGIPSVSIADNVDEVSELIELDEKAKAAGITVSIGAGFVPGLSCVLALYGAKKFDTVDEIHVAKFGTGGPACARNHHSALAGNSLDWREGNWNEGPGGSGRELCWFPDPIGGADCYRASLPDALLLQSTFPTASRITSRLAATRRDRLTARLPMLRKPHPEGLIGGARIEIRGVRSGEHDTDIYGAIDRPASAAATVAALVAEWAASKKLASSGAAGLSSQVGDPARFLSELSERGVKVAQFEGA